MSLKGIYLNCLCFFVLNLIASTSFAQLVYQTDIELDWTVDNWTVNPAQQQSIQVYAINQGSRHEDNIQIPYLSYSTEVSSNGKLEVDLNVFEQDKQDLLADLNPNTISQDFRIEKKVERNGSKYYARVKIWPLKNVNGDLQGIKRAQLKVYFKEEAASSSAFRSPPTNNSLLSSGNFHKIAVNRSGIFRIDATFIQETMGIDLSSIDPNKIRLFGHGGGRLPINAGVYEHDDLPEIPIFVSGQSDGSFDNNDYILFYGEGANRWEYSESAEDLIFNNNTYSTKNYYFLQLDANEDGQRVSSATSVNSNNIIDSYDYYFRKEDELYNILNYITYNQGSGQEWFGDLYKNTRKFDYPFSIPDLIIEDSIRLKGRFASRSSNSGSYFEVIVDEDNTYSTNNFASTELDDPTEEGAFSKTMDEKFPVESSSFNITVNYPPTGGNSEGWLDYLQIESKCELIKRDKQLTFQSFDALNYSSVKYDISSSEAFLLWEITNPINPVAHTLSDAGNSKSFGVNTTGSLQRFIAFTTSEALSTIEYIGKVPAQNLHAIESVDMIIISHPTFLSHAEQLKDIRQSSDGLSVAIVTPEQIYNEFSSGKADAAAIRNFVKHVYEKDGGEQLKFLLLFGDGSFDNRNILGLGQNFIPTYETEGSLDPIRSYPSDDYYGLLDNGEGNIKVDDFLNVSIGRLPVKNQEEAQAVVNKIANYQSVESTFGDWKIKTVFVADDEDNMVHTRDCDELAVRTLNKYPWMNQDKVYIDAFEQEATSFGTRIPRAKEAIKQNIFKGALAVTYLGHGGATGWAQERILQIPDIAELDNNDKLPVFITATCSFAGYDDPNFTTGGEETLLNANGGAIAMFTTVRAVYASQNKELSKQILDTLFTIDQTGAMHFGDALLASKNSTTTSASNHRKFTLLGDPSQRLALPSFSIETTQINEQILDNSSNPDTLSSLEQITIKGRVVDAQGQVVTNFNGRIYPTIFDKKTDNTTLGQDDGSYVYDYQLQKNIIFKGLASVNAGEFEFSFVVPKDIDFEFGQGKISYYAFDEAAKQEAKGYYDNIIIGGSSDNAIVDDEGPEVNVYLNSEDFVFGGITSNGPTLLVKLDDDYGINVVGNSVGHDLTGVLDDDTKNTYLLNDFYQAELDDFTKGEVRFPLSNLEEGRHTIRVKAWDIANNSSEGYTEFIVSNSGELALEQVLNYPNPFTDKTCFQFEHNMEGQTMDIQVQIFSVSGKLVKTINTQINPQGSRLSLGDCIEWNGKDDFGSQLAKGVYVYKIRASVQSGVQEIKGESAFEKLVILK